MAASENEQDIKIDPELTKPWGYPEGFKAALRELYERSFEECEMATDTQLEVLETWRELGADAADLLHDVCDDRYYSPSLHSAKICMAGRPDLTAEMLALSDRWRQHFSSEEIAHTETRQNAFEAFFTRTMSGMKNVPASSTDSRVEDSGYRPLTIGGQTYLIHEGVPVQAGMWWVNTLMDESSCQQIAQREASLIRIPFLSYHLGDQHHHLFCSSCQNNAPRGMDIFSAIAGDQFLRAKRFLENMERCLDFSETKLDKLNVALRNPEGGGISFLCTQSPPGNSDPRHFTASVREAALWRVFVLANYLPYVCDMSIYCSPSTFNEKQPANPWTTLRAGNGYPAAVQFVQGLSREHFETALLAHEVFSAMNDYPDWFAFGPNSFPLALGISSSDEGLQRIPGFLNIREGTGIDSWSEFLSATIAEDLPNWGFDVIETVMKLAAKAAKLALIETSNDRVNASMLEAIANDTHAIHEARRPMWESDRELQMESKQEIERLALQVGKLE